MFFLKTGGVLLLGFNSEVKIDDVDGGDKGNRDFKIQRRGRQREPQKKQKV